MSTSKTWKESLGARVPEALGREIDIFETQIDLRKKGKIEEKLFAETRLRRGAYGQRYDNGQRHDGEKTQALTFPSGSITKGPTTMWDAPGMQRIKIPFGRMTCDQLDVLADVAEEYSDRILHVTTRQDIQLHFVHIEDTPDMMRRLAAVGITTREACGNTVRNVTACQYAGVCQTESFDVAPYANGLTYFLLGHEDTQDFGRKFKVAFSGCKENACGLTNFHDIGAIARTRTVDGVTKRGFELYVGGGLGAVPQAALLFDEFLPVEELLPLSQAISRVFSRLGERANRARARLKFVVKKLGIEEFKRVVLEERAKLRPDPRWTAYLADLHVTDEKPIHPPGKLPPGSTPEGFARWRETNVMPQSQDGYVMATITLPLGDLTSEQGHALADVARRFTGDTMRTTADQNLLMRWVSEADLVSLYSALAAIDLVKPGAGSITDITACPGTDTCKLGISSSRALAAELGKQLSAAGVDRDKNAKHLHIKTSGCFNSCGQHHVADIGFLGVSRNVGGRRVPHFQLVVGGQWTNNAGAYGLAIGAVPSKRVPEIVKRLTERYSKERVGEESFADFASRIGKKTIRAMVEELQVLPTYEQDPSYYSDWGDPREYTISDMGEGECAGEVVPYVEVGLANAEREIFESQILLDDGNVAGASERAFSAMLQAARALTREKNMNLGTEADEVVGEFRKHFYDTELFFDPFAGGRFAQYLFRAHEERSKAATADSAHQLIEEATLFVDAAHQCYTRLGAGLGAAGANINIAPAAGRPAPPPEDLRTPMDAHKLQLKIFAEPAAAGALELETFIPVFHRWIKDHLLPELVIDVANYAHVPNGPGVVLIGHGSDYFVDRLDGRLGLLHSRKRAGLAPAERLTDLARRTLHAAALLEKDPALEGKLRFRPGELLFRVNDRLAATNTDASFAAVKPALDALATRLYGGPVDIARVGGPKDPLSLRITSNAPVTLATLLERAGGPPAADASLVA